MSERTDQLTRSSDETVDESLDDAFDSGSLRSGSSAETEPEGDASGLERWFDPGTFLVSAVLLAVGLVGGGATIPFFGRALGMFAVAFAVGLASSERRYAEVGLAGVAVGGGASLLRNALLTLAGVGVPLVAVSAVVGGLAGVLGVYFGRDLRDGLTRDL
ncbi:EscU/YscU/HrcU family type III secretion system export apparatus switch protein [Halostella litorea]|uniref:EscU/YscU/HrcU family type III secretion system export apparatus switch protein n=1 Tax=Halostella litorea TaxID=2528831 RepID=UPI001091D3E5|nr:EscU/YscU/HrcU family type III secretion system export apparatus switch protein [Halostella litorea]